jgi:hypothetical protein
VARNVNADLLPALAIQHLWNARHMAALCRKVEDDLIADGRRNIDYELRGLAMMAFASAAAFVESLINEIFSAPAAFHRRPPPTDGSNPRYR